MNDMFFESTKRYVTTLEKAYNNQGKNNFQSMYDEEAKDLLMKGRDRVITNKVTN